MIVFDEDGLSVPQHDDHIKQHAYEGANLDHPCRQRDCVPASIVSSFAIAPTLY